MGRNISKRRIVKRPMKRSMKRSNKRSMKRSNKRSMKRSNKLSMKRSNKRSMKRSNKLSKNRYKKTLKRKSMKIKYGGSSDGDRETNVGAETTTSVGAKMSVRGLTDAWKGTMQTGISPTGNLGQPESATSDLWDQIAENSNSSDKETTNAMSTGGLEDEYWDWSPLDWDEKEKMFGLTAGDTTNAMSTGRNRMDVVKEEDDVDFTDAENTVTASTSKSMSSEEARSKSLPARGARFLETDRPSLKKMMEASLEENAAHSTQAQKTKVPLKESMMAAAKPKAEADTPGLSEKYSGPTRRKKGDEIPIGLFDLTTGNTTNAMSTGNMDPSTSEMQPAAAAAAAAANPLSDTGSTSTNTTPPQDNNFDLLSFLDQSDTRSTPKDMSPKSFDPFPSVASLQPAQSNSAPAMPLGSTSKDKYSESFDPFSITTGVKALEPSKDVQYYGLSIGKSNLRTQQRGVWKNDSSKENMVQFEKPQNWENNPLFALKTGQILWTDTRDAYAQKRYKEILPVRAIIINYLKYQIERLGKVDRKVVEAAKKLLKLIEEILGSESDYWSTTTVGRAEPEKRAKKLKNLLKLIFHEEMAENGKRNRTKKNVRLLREWADMDKLMITRYLKLAIKLIFYHILFGEGVEVPIAVEEAAPAPPASVEDLLSFADPPIHTTAESLSAADSLPATGSQSATKVASLAATTSAPGSQSAPVASLAAADSLPATTSAQPSAAKPVASLAATDSQSTTKAAQPSATTAAEAASKQLIKEEITSAFEGIDLDVF